MCVALVGLCASAQEKGDMAVGLNLGVAPCLESGQSITNFGIGAKFQYNITNPIRLEADVDYWMKNKGVDVFDISVNAHYLFNIGEKLKVYPLVGVGYANCSKSKVLINAGAGVEYPITEKLSVGAEIKYQYMEHFGRLPISIGVAYKF